MSYQWNPTADSIERVNVTRVARAHGVAGIEELPTRSAVTWACSVAPYHFG